MSIPFTLTNESATVIYNGKPYTVQKSSPHFASLRAALISEDWDVVPKHLTVNSSLTTWAKGKFTVNDTIEVFSFEGTVLPPSINQRIVRMHAQGKDPAPLFRFYERLQKNPSFRSVEQLYDFLKHGKIPLTTDGCFLAYKGVNEDFTDRYTGTIDNRPGVVHKMPRNKISDDPRQTCHFGYHVGAVVYARSFGPKIVICKVDPEHVVCVPYDASQQKMRVCEYKVIGHYGVHLPDDIIEDDDFVEDTKSLTPHTVYAVDDDEDQIDEEDIFSDPETTDSVEMEEVEEEEPVEEEPKKGELVIPREYRKWAKLSYEELMQLSREDIRALATYGFKIVGASKIPGGKTAVIAKILELRGDK